MLCYLSKMSKLRDLGKSTSKASSLNDILVRSLKELRSDIRTDQAGLNELEILLAHKLDDKAKCEIDIARQIKVVETVITEDAVGAVMIQTGQLQAYLEEQYTIAKHRHADEMKRLSKNFGYHQSYKRGIAKREFTGTFYTPPRLAKKA